MNIVTIVSIALGVLLLIGLLLGFLRSWKKSLIRGCLIILSFLVAFILSSKISTILMDKFVDGLVISVFGLTLDFESIVGDIAGDLFSEGSSLTNLATAIMNIFVKLIAFLIIFVTMMILTLIVYYIIVAIMHSRKKKRSVGDNKEKIWERLIGAFIGMVSSLIVCLALFNPVFGVMDVCDKFLEDEQPAATASAYSANNYVCGKFYTEDDNIGKVEGYLEKYDKIRTEYKNSFAGVVFKFTGTDALGRTVFSKLSTVTKNGVKVDLTDECVNFVKVYNLYKANFVEKHFDITNNESVEALESIYDVVKNSEAMKSVIVDLVPKMASKWTTGEKFLGMEIPVKGDMQEIVIDLLTVFNTDDFDTIDRNMGVAFEAIKIANNYDVISKVNSGENLTSAIEKDGFVRDEINNLATTAEFRQVLPNMLTTTIKVMYRTEIGEPGDKLDQDFTQEQIAKITWSDEANTIQAIVSKITKILGTEDIVDCLGEYGEVIDLARESDILSKPVRVFMQDYIDLKTTSLNETVRKTLVEAFSTSNWNDTNYSYTNLFRTVQVTAKVANKAQNADFTDIPLEDLLKNESAKDTLQEAVNNGIIKDLVDDEKKAQLYEDMVKEIISDENEGNVGNDLKAGSVVSDIVNKSDSENSMFSEENRQAEADQAVTDLTNSEAVMKVIRSEATKSDTTEGSDVKKEYIDTMNDADKEAFQNAIDKMADSEDKKALQKLFGTKNAD